MALRDCADCGKQVSTHAAACPHCGCPQHRAVKSKSNWYLSVLLLLMLSAGLLNMVVDTSGRPRLGGDGKPINNIELGAQKVDAAPRCDAVAADRFIKKSMEAQIFYRLDSRASLPKIYVMPQWYTLAVDDKRALDNAVQCHLMRGVGKPVLASYLDYQSGREVADTGEYGFTLK